MPTVNVTERKVAPRLDTGLLAGAVAGIVVWVWMLLIGALGDGGAADYPVFLSGLVLGDTVLTDPVFGLDWLVGTAVHFVTWGLIGIIWALVWPRVRQYGTFSPALIFAIVMYVLIEQLIGRLINPAIVDAIGFTGLWIGYLLGGFTLAWRYRSA